jgi:hypothetical protein
MAGQSIKLVIDADASKMSAGIKTAITGVEASAAQFKTALSGMGSSAASASQEWIKIGGASKTAAAGMKDGTRAATDAAAAQKEASKAITQFKESQGRARETGTFFLRELSAIVPISAEAQGAMGGVSQAVLGLAMGGGVAMSAVTLVAAGLAALGSASAKHAEDLKALRKTAYETWTGYADAMESVRKSYAGGQTKALQAHQDQLDAEARKIRDLKHAITEAYAEKGPLGELGDAIADLFGRGSMAEADLAVANIKKIREAMVGPQAKAALDETQKVENVEMHRTTSQQIASIEASTASQILQIQIDKHNKLADLAHDEKKYGADYAALRVATEREAAEKIRKISADEQLAYQAARLAATSDLLSAEERLFEQSSQKIAALREKKKEARGDSAEQARIDELIRLEGELEKRQASRILASEQLAVNVSALALALKNKELTAIEALEWDSANRISALRAKELLAQGENAKAAVAAEIATEEQALEEAKRAQYARERQADAALEADRAQHKADVIAKDVARYGEAIGKAKERLQPFADAASTLGTSLGQAFADAATGAKSFGAAMTQVLKDVVGSVIASAQKVIMANALEAAAEAFVSQAGTPFIGPLLGAAALTAALGLVGGLVSSLPSAAGGFNIPAGMNPVTQLHEKEMVLPRHIADPLREQLAGGGMGGTSGPNVTVQINSTVTDVASLRTFIASEQFKLAMREATRNGRL